MRKLYRIFEIVNGTPVITEPLNRKSNWFDTEEQANFCLMSDDSMSYFYGDSDLAKAQFTILPVYETDKSF